MTKPDGYDARVIELSRMPKWKLAAYYREHSGLMWSAVPPEKWSKDQLVSDCLAIDFYDPNEDYWDGSKP